MCLAYGLGGDSFLALFPVLSPRLASFVPSSASPLVGEPLPYQLLIRGGVYFRCEIVSVPFSS